MSHFAKITALLLLMSIPIACQSSPQASGNSQIPARSQNSDGFPTSALQFSDVTDKDWNLVEVWLDQKNTGFDRRQLAGQDFRKFFTLRFDADRAGGTGAPNYFGGPYSLADNQAITFGAMAATLMAPLFEPENLSEHEYLIYLQSTYKWNVADGKLELYSKDANGAERILVFDSAL